MDCVFCKIVAGELPSTKLYEDDQMLVFQDIAPAAPLHYLAIPKTHIPGVDGITADNSAVIAHIFEKIAALTAERGISDYRVVSNVGEQAGQTVRHLHFHILSGPKGGPMY
ncbi:MAG: histidine triad nucleotide-binding protein [Clostridiales bacterium]|nr:histidine triad nucleotide-binding protein [Clostridiales bacterium]